MLKNTTTLQELANQLAKTLPQVYPDWQRFTQNTSDIVAVDRTGDTLTVTTATPHNLVPGDPVRLAGLANQIDISELYVVQVNGARHGSGKTTIPHDITGGVITPLKIEIGGTFYDVPTIEPFSYKVNAANYTTDGELTINLASQHALPTNSNVQITGMGDLWDGEYTTTSAGGGTSITVQGSKALYPSAAPGQVTGSFDEFTFWFDATNVPLHLAATPAKYYSASNRGFNDLYQVDSVLSPTEFTVSLASFELLELLGAPFILPDANPQVYLYGQNIGIIGSIDTAIEDLPKRNMPYIYLEAPSVSTQTISRSTIDMRAVPSNRATLNLINTFNVHIVYPNQILGQISQYGGLEIDECRKLAAAIYRAFYGFKPESRFKGEVSYGCVPVSENITLVTSSHTLYQVAFNYQEEIELSERGDGYNNETVALRKIDITSEKNVVVKPSQG